MPNQKSKIEWWLNMFISRFAFFPCWLFRINEVSGSAILCIIVTIEALTYNTIECEYTMTSKVGICLPVSKNNRGVIWKRPFFGRVTAKRGTSFPIQYREPWMCMGTLQVHPCFSSSQKREIKGLELDRCLSQMLVFSAADESGPSWVSC